MPSRYLILSLLFANLLLAIALLVFATGFFPYTPFLSARASFRDQDAVSKDTASPFDKIIFMVVDALRRLDLEMHCYSKLIPPATLFIQIRRVSNLHRGSSPAMDVSSYS